MVSPRRFRARHIPVLLGAAILAASAPAQQAGTSYRDTLLAIQQQIQANHLEEARTLLTTAFRRYPSDGGLENLLGIVEIQQGHVDRAKQAFAEAVQHSPKLTSAYLNLARIDMQAADTNPADRQEAFHLCEKVLQMEPGNAEANYNQAMLLMWEHRYEASLQAVARLDPETRRRVRVESVVCEDEVGLGHQEAANRAVAAMVANPDFGEADAMWVLPALRVAHRADLVDRLFTAANSRQQLSAAGLRILGLAQEAEGKLPEARATLERVYAMKSSDALPLIDLTRMAVAMKDYKGALGYLAHARALEPQNASLPYEFGVICLRMGLLGEASKSMGEALRLTPDNPIYNYGMGTVLSYSADPSQGLPYLEKFHQLRPADPVGALALGTAYFRNKDFDNATTWLRKAVDDPSTSAEAHFYLGRILRAQGDFDQAIAQLTESDKLKPDQAEVIAELGQVYLQKRDFPEAEKDLNRALVLDANNYGANFALMQLYAFQHDPRLDEQSKKFGLIRNKTVEQNQDAMRMIEIRPEDGSGN